MTARAAPASLTRKPPLTAVLAQLLQSRWRWMTLAALAVCVVVIRLGFWQLDRLAQRHAESAERAARLTQPPLVLDGSGRPAGASASALTLFRPVTVHGRLDGAHDLALTNVAWNAQLGIHVLTPLLLDDGRAILIDRGWAPVENGPRVNWAQFRLDGPAEITGWVRPIDQAGAQIAPRSGSPGATLAEDARLVPGLDVKDVQGRLDVPLLPFVVVQLPPAGQEIYMDSLPYRALPQTDLGDGVHLIAAVQWFVIAGIIVVGQVLYVRWQMMRDGGRETEDERRRTKDG